MADIKYIKGVGPSKEKLFNNLEIFSVSDLLHYLPRTYSDRRKNAPLGNYRQTEDVFGLFKVIESNTIRARNLDIFKVFFEGEDKLLYEAVWFKKRTFKFDSLIGLKKDMQKGKIFWLFAKREDKNAFSNRKILVEEYYDIDSPALSFNANKIIPIYALTKGLTQKFLRETIALALNKFLCEEQEFT